mmetsp:Transcript_23699/g.49617  ORF Transcript_23699/g.49617 Transcript_23699/m.49617 type:complete len:658 (-) Transcript_23699:134-2107(-)
MKRAVSSDAYERRSLKRANSSLFSIATLADIANDNDDHNGDPTNPTSETITSEIIGKGGVVGGRSSSKSNDDILLVDDSEHTSVADEDVAYSELKASGIVLPLDCSDDDVDVDVVAVSSSSYSSSSVMDGGEGDDNIIEEGVCSSKNSSQEESELGDDAVVDVDVDFDSVKQQPEGPISNCSLLPALLDKPTTPPAKKDNDRPLPTSSEMNIPSSSHHLPCEPPTSEKVEYQGQQQMQEINKSNDDDNDDHLTGLVFESGSNHFDRHNRFHKERPLRITSVRDYLKKKARQTSEENRNQNQRTILERCHLLESRSGGDDRCVKVVESDKKSTEDIWLDDYDYLRVHLPGYMQRLDKISKCNCHDRLDIEAEQFKSIYFTNESVREAKTAASSLCNLVSRVVSGNHDNGFAVIRPPGHHAEPGLAGGYCVINNVAVAAAYAREKLGVKKVLIVDWDVHHGNGTQRCFIDDPNVLYFSAHRYHGGNFFPFQQGGGPSTVGSGAGEGFNINVGWNEKRMGDDEYLVLWERLLMPIATEFDPDLVLISAGFDAARGDMGECDITPECFARLTRRLMTLANGNIVAALEGGYVRSVLCKCVESVLATLLDADSNEKCKKELQTFYNNVGDNEMLDCINPSAAKSIRDTMKAHSKYWDCLKGV